MVASKKHGGLGLGRLREAYLALLLKWWWRLSEDDNQLWVKVIKALNGLSWKKSIVPVNQTRSGIWKTIEGINKEFVKRNVDVLQKLVCKMCRGNKVRIWEDSWLVNHPQMELGSNVVWDWTWKTHPNLVIS
ncbi:hypothetical protein HanRHA438_Chr04g0155531 [Helianthus annuus]|nr:hypothetical protein HanRHA438_Chr04g0155531 [Helianthus annuus]